MKVKSFLHLACLALCGGLALSCSERTSADVQTGTTAYDQDQKDYGPIVSKKATTEPFSRMKAAGGMFVRYHVAERQLPSYTLSGPQEKLKGVIVKNDKGTLKISMKQAQKFTTKNNKHITVDVYGPVPAQLTASTAATIWVEQVLKIKSSLTLDVSNAGAIKARMEGRSLAVDASTAGYVELETANAEWLKLGASTAGYIKVKNAKAKTVELNASTSGNIVTTQLHAEQTAFFSASTAGKVTASGKGHEAYAKSSTSGNINLTDFYADSMDASASTAGKITLIRANTYKSSSATGGRIVDIRE